MHRYPTKKTYSQDVQDRAREIVNENYPDLDDDAAWSELFLEACEEIEMIDRARDRDEVSYRY